MLYLYLTLKSNLTFGGDISKMTNMILLMELSGRFLSTTDVMVLLAQSGSPLSQLRRSMPEGLPHISWFLATAVFK
jgi:hypothetical protein